MKDTRSMNPDDCYRDAWRYQLHHGGKLAHGTITAGLPLRQIEHSWVESGDKVICPHMGEMPKSTYYELVKPQNVKSYDQDTVMAKTARFMKLKEGLPYGPWDNKGRRGKMESKVLSSA